LPRSRLALSGGRLRVTRGGGERRDDLLVDLVESSLDAARHELARLIFGD